MKKILALMVAATTLASVTALAGPDKSKKPAKIKDVWHCPIAGEEVKDKKSKGVVVGEYRVHFCCAGCEPNFKKLSKKDQLAKAKEAAQKDTAKKG